MDEKILRSLKKKWPSLVKQGQPLKFHKGQVLFYEGHDPYGVFVVQTGKIRFERMERNLCGEEHLWTAPQGEVIGLQPFFDEHPYCCSCLALSDCEVLFIPKSQLLSFSQTGK